MNEFPLSQKSRNLTRFCRHADYENMDASFSADFAFRDRGSRFSILKNTRTLPGPDECYALHEMDPRLFFSKLLGLEMDFPGLTDEQKKHYQLYNSMNYYRSHIEEIFYPNGIRPLPPLEGSCAMFFEAADRLVVHYVLRNTSAADLAVKLRFKSSPENAVVLAGRRGFAASSTLRSISQYEAWAAVTASDDDLRFVETGGEAVSAWVERSIPAMESVSVTFSVDFDIDRAPQTSPPPANPKKSCVASIAETEAAYSGLAALPNEFKRFENLVLKAVGCLRTLRYFARNRDGEEIRTMHAAKTGIGATYFWDTCFGMLGLGLFGDLEMARNSARMLIGGIKPDGTPPCTFQGYGYRYSYQQPILAWGLGQFMTIHPDPALLETAYEPICRYVNHWLSVWDKRGSGLVVHPDGGTCWDDALRWQNSFPLAFEPGEDWTRKDWGNAELSLFECVDTNSHLYLECRNLARFASMLGNDSEAIRWDERAEALKERINSDLFNPDEGVYQDRSIRDGRFTGMVSAGSFLPLYAGIAPKEIAERLSREYLLNPDRFYTTLPFPTLDRSHPAFRSGGFLFAPPEQPGSLVQQSYWIGRTWPHVSFWLVGALHQSGLTSEADAAAEKILDAMDRSEGIYEVYDSLTGCGNGHPEYIWSAAAVLALAYRRYRGGVG